MSINEIQDEIIEEFAEFTEWMDKYQMLIDLGNDLDTLAKAACGCNAILKTVSWCLQPILTHLSPKESLPCS